MSFDLNTEMKHTQNLIRRNNETLSAFNMRLNIDKFKSGS